MALIALFVVVAVFGVLSKAATELVILNGKQHWLPAFVKGKPWPAKRLWGCYLPPEFNDIHPYQGLPTSDTPNWPHPWKAGKFQMTMSLRKLCPDNWLTYDSAWEKYHMDKLRYMDGPLRDEVLQTLPGIDPACEELLQVVVEYITRRYPDMFRIEGEEIVIVPIGERHRIVAPFKRHPMEICGLLVMEDLYVLTKGENDLFYLRACFLACPSGWVLKQRIGWPLHQIHGPVPLWKEKLQKSMEKFFLNLKVDAPIQRNNVFIQPCKGIFHQEPMESQPVSKTLEDIEIRTELQSLRRLPVSQAIVFSVRTYMNPLTDLEKEPKALNRLWDAVKNYPDATAAYKVRHLWVHLFEPYCQKVLGRTEPDQTILEEED